MQKSPFKFLDSFTKEDREIFFGRDMEIEELHSRVFQSKILLVYGTSGTGKSSLINCGLANRFNDSDWLPVSVRRGRDINISIAEALQKIALTRAPFEKALKPGITTVNLDRLLRSVYLDHFKPIFLILDQFEELFIFGSREEKAELIRNVARIIDSDIQCRFIFSMREEYLAGVTEFEKVIPSFLSNRMRIEKMTRHNAVKTIEGPCSVNNILTDPGFAENLLNRLNPDSPEVELTWLQVFLDKAFRTAAGKEGSVNVLTNNLLAELGDVKDILGNFLDEQISRLDDPETGLVVLKSFVSVKGTRNQIAENEIIEYTATFGKKIEEGEIRNLIQKFISLRILRDKDESGRYELRHDSLASKIFEKITLVEKELLEVKYFIENAWVNFERRKQLLSEDDLNYIAPYEDKLYLGEKYLSFISHSKAALVKWKRRRQNLLTAAALIIFAVLTFFTVWAMRERSKAINLRQEAEDQRNVAVKAKDDAETARIEAITQRTFAEANARVAEEAKKQSDLARQQAVASREDALKQKAIAENLSTVASEQARVAERQRQIADEQRAAAVIAEEKARKLSLLSKAQNLALISQTLSKKPQIMGLLAVQAYNFNLNNGGNPNNHEIYKALNKAWLVLDKAEHSSLPGSENEIRSLAENEKGITGADIDGYIVTWNTPGDSGMILRTGNSSPAELVSIDRSGEKLLTAREDNRISVRSLTGNEQETILMSVHKGQVTNAAWGRNGRIFATGGTDSLVCVWNTEKTSANPLAQFKGKARVSAMEFCGNDTLFVSFADGSLLLYNLGNKGQTNAYSSPGEVILSMTVDYKRGSLLAGTSSGVILRFGFNDDLSQPKRFAGHPNGTDNIIMSNGYDLVATAGWDKAVHIYNYSDYFEKGDNVQGVIIIDNLGSRTRSLLFTKDNRLITALADRSLRIFETSSSILASKICGIINRDMYPDEWNDYVGEEIPYEKTCGTK